jgi:hypothetical protein
VDNDEHFMGIEVIANQSELDYNTRCKGTANISIDNALKEPPGRNKVNQEYEPRT